LTSVEDCAKIVKDYYELGCRFVVIRQDYSMINPIEASRQLAKKAKLCQEHGIVPIVRPVLNEYSKLKLNQVESFFGNTLEQLMDKM
jgi:fructose-bisphosphate aldolase class 1